MPNKTKKLPTSFNELKMLQKLRKIESLSSINQSKPYQPNKQNKILIKDTTIPETYTNINNTDTY